MRRVLSTVLAGLLATFFTLSGAEMAAAGTTPTVTCKPPMVAVTMTNGKQRCVLKLRKPAGGCPPGGVKDATTGKCKRSPRTPTTKCSAGFHPDPTTNKCVRTVKKPPLKCLKKDAAGKCTSKTPKPPKKCLKKDAAGKCTSKIPTPPKKCPAGFKLTTTGKSCVPNRPHICKRPLVWNATQNKCAATAG